MEAFQSRSAEMVHRYCHSPSFVHSKITNWYIWVPNQSLVSWTVPRVPVSNGSTPLWELRDWSIKDIFPTGKKRQPGICSDIHSSIHSIRVYWILFFFFFYSGHVFINYIWNTNKSPVCPCVGWKVIGWNYHCLVLRQFKVISVA